MRHVISGKDDYKIDNLLKAEKYKNAKTSWRKYNPENEEPYELDRSELRIFLRATACFYLEKVKGFHFLQASRSH